MKTAALPLSLLLLVASWMPFGAQPPAGFHEVKLNGHVFTLPAGFEIELVAGPPLVDRPITADFDEAGRLYVADSSGSNDPIKVQLNTKTHRVVRLEDTKGTGKFDRATVFADNLMFPEGTMWFDGSLYVSAVPQILKLTDTDGDGVADTRSVWFDGKTWTGCANDLHGPYRGPDGWIYWCKGAFARQTYETPGKAPFSTRAAHVFRARPDGSGVEPVMTGGMDNPVDLVFTPGGERIFTTTFFQFPGGGQRDGLVHAVYGGVYGKDWEVIHEPAHKWTGPAVMPVLTHVGPAAPAGLHRYESTAFGPEYQDNLFAALFNLQKITRHVLEPHGATFKSRDSDFVVSNNKDFHPTDVIEDADGSLLIVDTGGWYKLCCPTSQLVKPDVLGAIYRVRKKDAPKVDDPRGRTLNWATLKVKQLADLLGDPRPAVRRRATDTLAERGPAALEALTRIVPATANVDARRNAVWCATRIRHPLAAVQVLRGLLDPDDTVRQAALHGTAVRRDPQAVPALLALFWKGSAQNRRAAAEALGRIGDKRAVPILLAAADAESDRFLEHALIYALIEIGDAQGTAAGIKGASARTRRVAMIALDQMQDAKPAVKSVTDHLAATDSGLKEAAWWIASRHAEWGAELSTALRERLAAKETPAQRDDLVQQLARLARSPAIQTLLADRVTDASASTDARRLVLQAMARADLKEAPAAWFGAIAQVLASDNAEVVAEAVATARNLRLPKQPPQSFGTALTRLGSDPSAPGAVRVGALAAVPGGIAVVEPAIYDFLVARLNANEPVAQRTLAADALARAKLTNPQLRALCAALRSAGPMELPRLLDAFDKSSDASVGHDLVEALAASSVRKGLRPETLKPLIAKFGPAVLKSADSLLASLEGDAGKQKAHLEEILAKLPAGDVRRGQGVFNGTKAACAACHQIGYLGGKIGPDLTRIGGIRTDRDLVESIVFPSASFVRGYEPVLITTQDGKVVNGLPRKDAPDEVILVVGANQEVRIAREQIEDMQPGRVSIMPAGLDQQLTMQELADLVAFLKACR
jgi:putative membrane-bound dehydrogenase-like protein